MSPAVRAAAALESATADKAMSVAAQNRSVNFEETTHQANHGSYSSTVDTVRQEVERHKESTMEKKLNITAEPLALTPDAPKKKRRLTTTGPSEWTWESTHLAAVRVKRLIDAVPASEWGPFSARVSAFLAEREAKR